MAIMQDKVVSMFYELTDTDGNVLDSNMKETPLSFIMGKNQIIPGLEDKISKFSVGDKTKVFIKAVDAYGNYDNTAKQVLPSEQFAGLELQVGMTLYGQGEDGNTAQVVVKAYDKDSVTIDFNHPLAGKDLTFDIEIVEVREATEDELLNGSVAGTHSCGCGGGESEGCCGGGDDEDKECCGKHNDKECSDKHTHEKNKECCGHK